MGNASDSLGVRAILGRCCGTTTSAAAQTNCGRTVALTLTLNIVRRRSSPCLVRPLSCCTILVPSCNESFSAVPPSHLTNDATLSNGATRFQASQTARHHFSSWGKQDPERQLSFATSAARSPRRRYQRRAKTASAESTCWRPICC